MTSAERTYSFRAAGDLAERMRHATRVLRGLEAGGQDVAEPLAREVALALARDDRRFRHAGTRGQSAFIRDAVELLVGAAEKVASDQQLTDAYAAARADATEEELEAARATRAASRRRFGLPAPR